MPEEVARNKKVTQPSKAMSHKPKIISGELYHMNKKIENLIEELANECEKESLGLSLAVADDECVAIKIAGPANLYAISILEQRNLIKKSFRSNCNCEECQTFRRCVLKYQKEKRNGVPFNGGI